MEMGTSKTSKSNLPAKEANEGTSEVRDVFGRSLMQVVEWETRVEIHNEEVRLQKLKERSRT